MLDDADLWMGRQFEKSEVTYVVRNQPNNPVNLNLQLGIVFLIGSLFSVVVHTWIANDVICREPVPGE